MFFLDTDFIIEENFFKEGNRIETLLKLANSGEINIITTEFVRKEVKHRLKNNIISAVKALRECEILKNITEFNQGTNGLYYIKALAAAGKLPKLAY